MSKLRQILLVATILLGSVISGIAPQQVFAAEACNTIEGVGVAIPKDATSHRITVNVGNENDTYGYYVKVENPFFDNDEAQSGTFRLDEGNFSEEYFDFGTVSLSGNVLTLIIKNNDALQTTLGTGEDNAHQVNLFRHQNNNNIHCEIGNYYTPKNTLGAGCQIYISQQRNNPADNTVQQCYYGGAASCLQVNTNVTIRAENLVKDGAAYSGPVRFVMGAQGWDAVKDPTGTASNGVATGSFVPDTDSQHTLQVQGGGYDFPGCSYTFNISDNCQGTQCNTTPTASSGNGVITPDPFLLCDQLPEGSDAKEECIKCATGDASSTDEEPGDESRKGIWTAFGCVNRAPEQIAGELIRLGLSIGGGIGLLMILGAGFIFSTSQGDPKRVGDAKDLMTAAVTGLLFIIFPVNILQFIGFSVLQIPGFGGS